MKKLVLALVPFLLIGCGEDPADTNGDGIADGVQDPNNVSVVVPATPKGTVSGQVLTTQQRPLSGVKVAMTIGSSTTPKEATTDEGGNFTFQDIPGGAQILLTFTKEGYAPLRAFSTVPTTAGNVPINNGNASFGPVLLSETSGSVKFTLISPTGRPAAGVKASLEVDGAGVVLFGPTASVSSTVVAEAVADAQGVVTFANVPPPAEIDRITTGAVYKLVVYAYDENNDGILESNGLVQAYTGAGLLTGSNAPPLALQFTYSPSAPLAIEFTNMAALKSDSSIQPQHNMLKPGESIYVVFNQPVQPSSVIMGLTDEYGKESISINKTVSNGGTVVTFSPQGIQPGKEYNLYYRAVAANGNSFSSKTIAFFGGDPANPLPISVDNVKFQELTSNNGLINSSTTAGAGEDVYVSFNQVMAARLQSRYAYVFIGADLNNSGRIGDNVGERAADGTTVSPTSGYPLEIAEPTAPIATRIPAELPVFPFSTSGYTTRFRFRYTGSYIPTGGTAAVPYTALNPTSNFPIYILFSALDPTTDAYESGWGVAQTANITIQGSTVTPIGVPVP